MFWNHSKQHSSKTFANTPHKAARFGTIRNNTALKHDNVMIEYNNCFGTIRNNTALKPVFMVILIIIRFGTIRNNTALKRLRIRHTKRHVLEPFETTQL